MHICLFADTAMGDLIHFRGVDLDTSCVYMMYVYSVQGSLYTEVPLRYKQTEENRPGIDVD